MATVHRATDIRLDRQVAVELLRPEVSRDPDLAQRFRREALAATVLRHPNIVACLDTGTDGEQPFLVMDLVDGEDLAARLKRGGRLAPTQVALIGLDVARAMGVAHVRGIVHRDIKPGNILLAADGRAMVTDFGIAKIAMDAEASLPNTTLGSVHYFSPEQARGATTTPASDVYGLGLVLYEALTGERAWGGDSSDAIALARVGAVAPSVRERRPEVPAELDASCAGPSPRSPGTAIRVAARWPRRSRRWSWPATPRVRRWWWPCPGRRHRPTGAGPRVSRQVGRPDTGPARAGRRPVPTAMQAPSRVVRGTRPGRRRRSGPPTGVIVPSVGPWSPAGPPWRGLGALPALGDGPGRDPTAPDPGRRDDPRTHAAADTGALITAEPTLEPEPTPQSSRPSPPGEVADLCEPFLDIACGLGAGRYQPARFDPAVRFTLGDGWSTVIHAEDLVALEREEGLLTFAARIQTVFPDGEAEAPRDRARDLVEAFIATDGVGASDVAEVRIGGRRGLSVDLTPTGSDRVALYETSGATFYLEPDAATRIVVVDTKGGAVVLVIEPTGRATLADILATADEVAGSIDWP